MMKNNKKINKKNKSPMSIDITTSSEDELLNSSQDSTKNTSVIEAPKVGTSTNNANLNLCGTKQGPSNSNLGGSSSGTNPSENAKKHIKKKEYSRALFILEKIKHNVESGTVNIRDANDQTRYEAVIAEYAEQEAKAEKRETNEGKKRVRSLDDSSNASPVTKKSKAKSGAFRNTGNDKQLKRPLNEVVRDHLHVAMVDEKAAKKIVSAELWNNIEARVADMVMDHVIAAGGGPLPGFDSSEVVRGYRVIKCEDQYSLDFLGKVVAKISNEWEGSTIGLISAKDIPRRPRARIWLPKMVCDSGKLLKSLQLLNPSIPMSDWSVLKAEAPQKNSTSFLLTINEESIEPLSKLDNKLRFGLRQAKLKIFKAGTKIDAVDETSGLLDDMSLEVEPTEENNEPEAEVSPTPPAVRSAVPTATTVSTTSVLLPATRTPKVVATTSARLSATVEISSEAKIDDEGRPNQS